MKENIKSPLYRDSSKGIIFGVCAGLGDKFEIDPFFIRLLFVFLFFFYGTGVLAYLVLALLMKDKSAFVASGVQG
ncbi:MAG: PspC domain-containing protein [Patescibacteria group bacterium]